MDSYRVIELLEHIKTFDEHNSGADKIALDKAIEAIKFNLRAEELLKACTQLFNKQLESLFVLNMLEELIYYDECECDGFCLLEDIEYLLEYREQKISSDC